MRALVSDNETFYAKTCIRAPRLPAMRSPKTRLAIWPAKH